VSCLGKNTFYSKYSRDKKSTKKIKIFSKKSMGASHWIFFPGPTKIQKILKLEKELQGTKVMRIKNKNKV
jgi:hypothetical protein